MKITKVVLHNYRGFSHEEFEFTDGLNTIVGKSDAGKSALLKGIDFVLSNNQKGNVISNWVLNEKGKIQRGESCWVEIYTSDGHVVRRERTPSNNIYIIDDKPPIKNFSQGVPEDVQKIFNMGEINLQTQFETHFMLNDKPSEVAKTLNKMVNLEVIDEAISNASKILRKIKKQKDASDDNIKKYEGGVAKFDFLEDMERDVEELAELQRVFDQFGLDRVRLEEISKNIKYLGSKKETVMTMTDNSNIVNDILNLYTSVERLDKKGNLLYTLANSIREDEKTLEDLNDIIENNKLANELLDLMQSLDGSNKLYNKVADCADEIEHLETELKGTSDFGKYEKDAENIVSLFEDLSTIKKQRSSISNTKVSIIELEKELEKVDHIIIDNFAKIKGETCPACGQIIKKLEEEH